MFNQFTPSVATPTSVVGTWKAVNSAYINGQRQTELAVVQFKPDGTFVEGFDLANNASTYSGRYSYNSASQRISFIIDSAAGTGPQPMPFHQSALSSNISFGNPTLVRLNNDLTFAFQSASVSPSDFVLPPAPSSFADFTSFNNNRTFDNSFNFNSHPTFVPFF